MLGRGRSGGAARHLEQVRQTDWCLLLELAVLEAGTVVDCCSSGCSCCVAIAAHMTAALHPT